MQDDNEVRISVLIVDDRAENRFALTAVLETLDSVDIDEASSGADALRLLSRKTYAAVLLDVQMPEMDGYEVADLMRGTKRTRHTPIIFVTARATDVGAEVRGYTVGAVDYLIKPLQPEIVRSKVAVFVDLARHKHELETQRAQLSRYAVELERAKHQLQRGTEELERFATSAAIELSAPLNTVGACLDLVYEAFEGVLDGETMRMVAAGKTAAHDMRTMVDSLLELSRLSAEPLIPERTDMADLAKRMIRAADHEIQAAAAKVVVVEPMVPVVVSRSHVELLYDVLLTNCLQHGGVGVGVRVGSQEEQDETVYYVSDNGPGIPPRLMATLFEPLRRRSTNGTRKGHGLALAPRVMQLHGGRIWARPSPPGGTTICFAFPEAAAPD